MSLRSLTAIDRPVTAHGTRRNLDPAESRRDRPLSGPNRVSDARSQSRSSCTGQALGLAPRATATWHTGSPARVSSTAVGVKRSRSPSSPTSARRPRLARRPSATAGRDRAVRRDPPGQAIAMRTSWTGRGGGVRHAPRALRPSAPALSGAKKGGHGHRGRRAARPGSPP
jgi:hypothetical protein